MAKLNFDSCFLIDLEREKARSKSTGPAHAFLAQNPDCVPAITISVLGEFAVGFNQATYHHFLAVKQNFEILIPDETTAWHYSRIYSQLKAQGKMVGANDIWIAAASIEHGLSLVSRNLKDFELVPNLQVVKY